MTQLMRVVDPGKWWTCMNQIHHSFLSFLFLLVQIFVHSEFLHEYVCLHYIFIYVFFEFSSIFDSFYNGSKRYVLQKAPQNQGQKFDYMCQVVNFGSIYILLLYLCLQKYTILTLSLVNYLKVWAYL